MSIRDRNFAEANLPSSLDYARVSDDYLSMLFNRPADWRWRLPELDDIKLENDMINRNMVFQCTMDSFAAFAGDRTPGCTMDSFAAFAQTPEELDQQNAMQLQYDKDTQALADMGYDQNGAPLIGPAVPQPSPARAVSVSTAQTGNTATNILSGLVRDLTPVATQYAQQRLGYKPAAKVNPVTGKPVTTSSSTLPVIVIAAVGLGALLLLKK